MTDPIATVIAVAIHPSGVNPIYGENVLHLRVADEAAGAFLEIQQIGDHLKSGVVQVDPEELPILVQEAQRLLAQPSLQDDPA